MSPAELVDAADKAATVFGEHRTTFLAAAAVTVGVLLLLARVARRNGWKDNALNWAAATIALAFSAEGMWEAVTTYMKLDPWQALLVFAFAEVLMINEAAQARKKIEADRDPSRHLRAVWVIAVVAAFAAAYNAGNPAGVAIRAFMPLAVAWQWSSKIRDLLGDGTRQPSRWIWTPQRVGIHLGLLKPGDGDDLGDVFRERRIERLSRLALRLDNTGWQWLATRRALRLRRIANQVDEDVLDAVARRFQQGAKVQELIFGRVRVEFEDKLARGDAGDAPQLTQPVRADASPVTQADAVVAHDGDAPVDAPEAVAGDAPAGEPTQAAQPAVTRPDAAEVTHLDAGGVTRVSVPPRRAGRVVMTRPVSAPPADRDAAMADAVTRVLTQAVAIRRAASDAGLPEASVRREVNRRKEAGQKINGHSHELAPANQ